MAHLYSVLPCINNIVCRLSFIFAKLASKWDAIVFGQPLDRASTKCFSDTEARQVQQQRDTWLAT